MLSVQRYNCDLFMKRGRCGVEKRGKEMLKIVDGGTCRQIGDRFGRHGIERV